MPKRSFAFFIGVVVAILAVGLFLALLRGSEDTWLCKDGEWVKHGNPSKEMPPESCGEALGDEIVITSPIGVKHATVSPFTIAGRAKGGWFFEATFPMKLVDSQGNDLAASYVQAKSDWMTSDFVDFEGAIIFDVPVTTSAMLILSKDNPSGLPENDRAVSLPLVLVPGKKITVKVFFNNDKLDPEFSCNKVFPVEREVPKTMAVARAALEELLKGATEAEAKEGFFSNINKGVKIQRLTIENSVAKVDFDPQLEFQVGGSCRVAAIRWQIIETLKQFPAVQDVVISINGRTEDILQP